MSRIAACLLFLVFVFAAGPSAARTLERFALVIGNNRPLDATARTLRYADDDAVLTERLLREAGVHTKLLVTLDADSRRSLGSVNADGPARRGPIERAFGELVQAMTAVRRRGDAVEFLLFYSGHGDVDRGQGFVVLEDAKLSRAALSSLLSRSPAATNHVFIDACRSYFVAFERGPGGERAPYTGAGLAGAVPAKLANTGFVLSTTSDRESHEWERYQGGILSHELRSALRGAADANRDGRISYGELGAFFTRANQSIANPRFRPEFLVRAPGGELGHAILSWPRSLGLALRAGKWGHVYVESARGERLIDVHPAEGQPVALWVPGERPLFVRRNDELAEFIVNQATPVEIVELTPIVPAIVAKGAQSLALERLFALPFDRHDVHAFEYAVRSSRDVVAEPAQPGAGWSTLQAASGLLALMAAGAGLSLNGAALFTYLDAEGKSQLETSRANDRASDFNRASLGFHTAALISASAFTISSLWPNQSANVRPAGGATTWNGATLEITTRF
jgi:hypothetical protein